jgi:hypothetical protein
MRNMIQYFFQKRRWRSVNLGVSAAQKTPISNTSRYENRGQKMG